MEGYSFSLFSAFKVATHILFNVFVFKYYLRAYCDSWAGYSSQYVIQYGVSIMMVFLTEVRM